MTKSLEECLAYADSLPGCTEVQGVVKTLAAAVRSLDPAKVDQSIELASALEQNRALKIVADVRGLRIGRRPNLMIPTVAESYFDLACEEIEHRLRTEQWLIGDITMPLHGLPAGEKTA